MLFYVEFKHVSNNLTFLVLPIFCHWISRIGVFFKKWNTFNIMWALYETDFMMSETFKLFENLLALSNTSSKRRISRSWTMYYHDLHIIVARSTLLNRLVPGCSIVLLAIVVGLHCWRNLHNSSLQSM